MKPSYSVFMCFLLFPSPRGGSFVKLATASSSRSIGGGCTSAQRRVDLLSVCMIRCTSFYPECSKKSYKAHQGTIVLCVYIYIYVWIYQIFLWKSRTRMSAADMYHKDNGVLLSLLWARTVSCNKRRLGRLLAMCIWWCMGPYRWLWPIPGLLTWILSNLYTQIKQPRNTDNNLALNCPHDRLFFLIIYNLPHGVIAKVNSETHILYIYIYVICTTYLQTKVCLFHPSSFLLPFSQLCFPQCPLQAQTVAGSQCAAIARAASVIAVSPGPTRPADNSHIGWGYAKLIWIANMII